MAYIIFISQEWLWSQVISICCLFWQLEKAAVLNSHPAVHHSWGPQRSVRKCPLLGFSNLTDGYLGESWRRCQVTFVPQTSTQRRKGCVLVIKHTRGGAWYLIATPVSLWQRGLIYQACTWTIRGHKHSCLQANRKWHKHTSFADFVFLMSHPVVGDNVYFLSTALKNHSSSLKSPFKNSS